MRNPRTALVTALAVGLWAGMTAHGVGGDRPAPEAAVDFARQVRPILSANCFQCHGPDEKHRKADLRLDVRKGAFADLGGYYAIVPGKPDESELYLRLIEEDSVSRMPPPKSHKSLTADEIDLIRRWIEQGAKWKDHWAFVPPKRPPLPAVRNQTWPRNPIDYFILARLEREGLEPAAEADRRTWIRRVTLDLTGLPPTPAEVHAFLADRSPEAYERVVDRLLRSPHYGEHMARYWLDAARYGDTHGLHLDNYREMWPYRDWVIQAFNSNMPFDQFTLEQLAGDLLPNATLDQKIASGFNRTHVTTSEGGSIAEEVYVRNVVERVEGFGTVFLGMTIGCARCHEHKFDPVSQKEFYQLFAFFNNLDGNPLDGNRKDPPPVVQVPLPGREQRLAEVRSQLEKIAEQLAQRRQAAEREFQNWLEQAQKQRADQPSLPKGELAHFALDETDGNEVRSDPPAKSVGRVQGTVAWVAGKYGRAFQFDGKTHLELGDVGRFERDKGFSYGAWVYIDSPITGTVLSRMDDGAAHRGYDLYIGGGKVYVHLIHHWPNNAIRINTKKPLAVKKWQHVFITYDGSSKAEGVRVFIDGKPAQVEITHNSLTGSIRTDKAFRIGRRTPGAPFRGKIDDVRLFGRQLTPQEVAAVAGTDPIGPLLAIEPSKRTPEQTETLRRHFLETRDEPYRRLLAERSRWQAEEKKALAMVATTLVFKERPKPKDAYVLIRGAYDRKGEKVERATPAVLLPWRDEWPKNRLGLAKWLLDPNHPLTARVAVNRFWQQCFGVGIVRTAEDFGSQGEVPSHPQLLDYLAVDFIESGWNVKRLMKMMVLSATYRQSSQATPEKLARDPENRLLSRGPRFRLDAEMLRDQALAVSGLLVRKIGGPSVKPPQPSGIWEAVGYTSSNTARFKADTGDKIFRRSLYTFWKRTAPPPAMTIFDAPSRESCTVRRERTNTPLQALVLMNERQFVDAARALAQRIMTEGGSTIEDRIRFAFELVTARLPDEDELRVLRNLYTEQLQHYRKDVSAAKQLLNGGDFKPKADLPADELAAWTMVGNLLLNLDEVVNK